MPSDQSEGKQLQLGSGVRRFLGNLWTICIYSYACFIGLPRELLGSGLQVGVVRHAAGRQRSLAVTARIGSPKRGANIVKTQADLRQERREQLGDGNIWEAVVDSHQRLAEDVDIKKLLGTAFVIGVTFGTAFQPTHNNGYLPVSSILQSRETAVCSRSAPAAVHGSPSAL